jgi:hypothetical protein
MDCDQRHWADHGALVAMGGLIRAMTSVTTDLKEFKVAVVAPPVASGASSEPAPAPAPTACGDAADGKTAWDDSNDCYVAYKNGQIARAEAVCNRGLAEARCAKRPGIEGMLYFSLGLCAETRADWKSAKELYESSLQVRPGNADVKERLEAVTSRLASNP